MKKTLLTSAIAIFFTMGMLALSSCGGGEKDCDKKCDKTEECKKKCEKDGKACTGKKEGCEKDCKKACCSKEGAKKSCSKDKTHGEEGHSHGEGHEGHDHTDSTETAE